VTISCNNQPLPSGSSNDANDAYERRSGSGLRAARGEGVSTGRRGGEPGERGRGSVRATLGSHLVEVASSDQHTVKPWLSARLDYSPPVQDLTNEGFALTGGRLDTLEHRPVATLVYRYRQHTIDVFVRPESAHAPTPALRTVRGFNVARANGSGMDWLAVSDVSADVLSAFVQRLARADTSP